MFCSSDVSVQTINLPPKIKLSGIFNEINLFFSASTYAEVLLELQTAKSEKEAKTAKAKANKS